MISVESMIPLFAAAGADVDRQMASAIRQEEILGDVKNAMEQYRAILAEQPKSRAVAAEALFHIGRCLEKTGRRSEAYDTYTKIVSSYSEQSRIAGLARVKLSNWDNAIPGPLNLRFDQGEAGKLPPAWFVPALPKEADQWAQLRASGCMAASSRCAAVLVPANAPVRASNLMQSFSATAYRNKTVAFRLWIRLEAASPDDKAQAWMSEDRSGNQKGVFLDMSDKPVRSANWTYCELKSRIAPDATVIKLGVMSIGRGVAWVDRISFEIESDSP